MAWGKSKVQIDIDRDEIEKTLKTIEGSTERLEKACNRAAVLIKTLEESCRKATLKMQELKQAEDRARRTTQSNTAGRQR